MQYYYYYYFINFRFLLQCCVDHHNFFRLVQVNPTSNGGGGGGGGHGGPGLFTKLRGGTEKELSAELSEVSHNIYSTISTISTWISTGETPRGAALHACAEPKIQPAEQIRGEPAAAPAQTRDAGEGRRRPGHPPPLPAQPLPNPTPGQSHVPGGLLAAGQPRHAVAAARAGGL